jgi:hypothetical protein
MAQLATQFVFQCLRYRAGLCDTGCTSVATAAVRFYSLGFGVGFATLVLDELPPTSVVPVSIPSVWAGLCDLQCDVSRPGTGVSMPSVSGCALRRPISRLRSSIPRFYALSFGLCFATPLTFARVGAAPYRFYALGFGLCFATVTLWRAS